MSELLLDHERTIQRLRAGDRMHMELRDGIQAWWFEGPYQIVPAGVANLIVFGNACEITLVEEGDSLFGLKNNSQSWIIERP